MPLSEICKPVGDRIWVSPIEGRTAKRKSIVQQNIETDEEHGDEQYPCRECRIRLWGVKASRNVVEVDYAGALLVLVVAILSVYSIGLGQNFLGFQ